MKRKSPALWAFGFIVSAIVASMFGMMTWSFIKGNNDKPLTTLEPQGPNAQSIQNLVSPVFAIAMVVFVLVIGAVIFIAFKFRDTGDEDTADVLPSQLHGKTWLEIGWTMLPALILFVVAIGTIVTLSDLNAEPTEDALHVKVEGQQWWWKFSYDFSEYGNRTDVARDERIFTDKEDVVTADELVIPVGREVALTETSNDVIHSFWIPALNGKKDAVPGMTTEWKLQANDVGVYRGQCTEFCGLSHANMRMVVRAVSPADFQIWKADQQKDAVEPKPGTKEAAGKAVFKGQLCASCHLIRGVNNDQVESEKGVKSLLVSGVAPDLTHFASRGTFSGAIFNRSYPNPGSQSETIDPIPFGQTCKVRGNPGSGVGPDGKPVDQASLPTCDDANQENAAAIPFASAPGNPSNPANRVALAAWLRDPTAMKPMAADEQAVAGGKRRGMPNLKLSEEQIDQLVAYLNSLK